MAMAAPPPRVSVSSRSGRVRVVAERRADVSVRGGVHTLDGVHPSAQWMVVLGDRFQRILAEMGADANDMDNLGDREIFTLDIPVAKSLGVLEPLPADTQPLPLTWLGRTDGPAWSPGVRSGRRSWARPSAPSVESRTAPMASARSVEKLSKKTGLMLILQHARARLISTTNRNFLHKLPCR